MANEYNGAQSGIELYQSCASQTPTHRSWEGFDTRADALAGCLLCCRILEVSLWYADSAALPIELPAMIRTHEG